MKTENETVTTLSDGAIEYIEQMRDIHEFYVRNAMGVTSHFIKLLEFSSIENNTYIEYLQFIDDVLEMLQLIKPLKTEAA